jgi:hypothetical protein
MEKCVEEILNRLIKRGHKASVSETIELITNSFQVFVGDGIGKYLLCPEALEDAKCNLAVTVMTKLLRTNKTQYGARNEGEEGTQYGARNEGGKFGLISCRLRSSNAAA